MNATKGLTKLLILLLSLTLSEGFVRPADAHVLQGPHILELMVSRLGKAKRLLIKQKLTLHGNLPNENQPRDSVEIQETIRYAFPESFRSDILSETTQRIHIVSNGVPLTILDGKAAIEGETGFDRYKDVMLLRSRKLIEQHLVNIGVAIEISSFGRFQDKVAYIVGAQYPDETPSQLWVQKDTFLPLRWILKTASGDGYLEFRYLRWQKIKSIQYPMTIECYLDGRLVREIKVKSYTVEPEFPAALFDIEKLRAQYNIEAPPEPVSEDIGEVQKTIEDFKKRYE
jgi:hypothetical protein